MAEVMDATLAALMPHEDPASAATPFVTVDAGPSAASLPAVSGDGGPPPADIAAILARVQELERLNTRHVDNINGARAEAARWQTHAQEQSRVNQDLLSRLTTLMERGQSAAPITPADDPAEAFVTAIEQVALDGKKDAGKAFVAKFLAPRAAPATVTPAEVEAIIQRRETQRDEIATIRERFIEGIATRHKDITTRPETRDAIVHAYQALATDPAVTALYGPPPAAAQVTIHGVTWDGRLLERALADVEATQGRQTQAVQAQHQAVEAVPTQGGGAHQAPPTPRDPIVVPAELVALVKDPRVQAALTAVTGQKDPRSHLKHVHEHASDVDKARWKQQSALTGR